MAERPRERWAHRDLDAFRGFAVMRREAISPQAVAKMLSYDPSTGALHWLPRTSANSARPGWFNARFAGKPAFTQKNTAGYHHGRLYGQCYSAHRVAWALHYGRWPQGHVDHINGERSDNRICNLREASPAENARNARAWKTKKSGLPHGVSVTKNGRFHAQIMCNRKNYHLGYFETPQDAHRAYLAAKQRFGFHRNHGASIQGMDAQP